MVVPALAGSYISTSNRLIYFSIKFGEYRLKELEYYLGISIRQAESVTPPNTHKQADNYFPAHCPALCAEHPLPLGTAENSHAARMTLPGSHP